MRWAGTQGDQEQVTSRIRIVSRYPEGSGTGTQGDQDCEQVTGGSGIRWAGTQGDQSVNRYPAGSGLCPSEGCNSHTPTFCTCCWICPACTTICSVELLLLAVYCSMAPQPLQDKQKSAALLSPGSAIALLPLPRKQTRSCPRAELSQSCCMAHPTWVSNKTTSILAHISWTPSILSLHILGCSQVPTPGSVTAGKSQEMQLLGVKPNCTSKIQFPLHTTLSFFFPLLLLHGMVWVGRDTVHHPRQLLRHCQGSGAGTAPNPNPNPGHPHPHREKFLL